MNEFDELSATTQKELTSIFISDSKKQKKRFMDALLRCGTAEDQTPAQTLRSAIDSISNTIAALQNHTKTLSDVKRFHLRVPLPVADDDDTVLLTIQIVQKPNSHSLPLGYYIEVKPPSGEACRTPIVKKRGTYMNYSHLFDLGDRSPRHIEMLRSSDIEFRIYHKEIVLGKGKNVLIGFATAPLSSLIFSVNANAPLNFMAMDGRRTNFQFEANLSIGAPLVPQEELVIDEVINVIKE